MGEIRAETPPTPRLMKDTAWFQNRFMNVNSLGGWIGRIRWFNASYMQSRPKLRPYEEPQLQVKTELHGKTARSFGLTWLPDKNGLKIELIAKDGATYGREIHNTGWSRCPFSDDQMLRISAIMTSNLDMWICFQKTLLFILWFARRTRCKIGEPGSKDLSPFSAAEYDYFASLRFPEWDLRNNVADGFGQ